MLSGKLTRDMAELSKKSVVKAGRILSNRANHSDEDCIWARAICSLWRMRHTYVINTFQATLRTKSKRIFKKAIVAQRLKREVSIIDKLRRIPEMSLTRMGDIVGLRAVLDTVAQVEALVQDYKQSPRFEHELDRERDYIKNPKPDGYRCIHLIYKYKNNTAPEYNGLMVEIQIRSRLQHAWATAVETVGNMLGQKLKSGEGDQLWKDFFKLASAALAVYEKTPTVPGFEQTSKEELYRELVKQEKRLKVRDKIAAYVAVTKSLLDGLKNSQFVNMKYTILCLDTAEKKMEVYHFSENESEEANKAYSDLEKKFAGRSEMDVVLVSVNGMKELKKAYPNYFFDARQFISFLHAIEKINAGA